MLQLGAAASSPVRRDFRGPWFLINVLLAVVSLSVGTNFAFGIPTVFPKGLSLNKAGVQSGYVIVNLPDGKTYAIDVNGKFAKVWTSPVADTTLGYTRPLDNGNLLAFVGHNAGLSQAVEFTQAGAIAWQYTDAADRTFHHDLTRLANGNTLIVCSRVVHAPQYFRQSSDRRLSGRGRPQRQYRLRLGGCRSFRRI